MAVGRRFPIKPMPLTDKEVFDVYGLIVGMMKSEGRAVGYRRDGLKVSETPARDWARSWETRPSLMKARAIYEKQRLKASGIKPIWVQRGVDTSLR